MTIGFGQRISDLLGDLMSTAQPIEVKIFGNDYEMLQSIAAKAEHIMKTVPGIVDIDNGVIPAGASLLFSPRQDRLSQFGITLTDFQEQLTAHTGGIPLCQPANMIEPNPVQAAMTGGLQIGSCRTANKCAASCSALRISKTTPPNGWNSNPFSCPTVDPSARLFLRRTCHPR